MKSIWLAILIFRVVLVETENSGGFGYELIIGALESLQNNLQSLEHNFTSIGTKVDKSSAQLRSSLQDNLKSIGIKVNQLSAQQVHHTKATAAIINQLKHVIDEESRCPENADDGVYKLKPDYSSIPPFSVYCENGWIVIHRRFNGSLNFNRKWAPYREGFGDLQGEHWLGLEKMHQITRVGSYELMVVLKSFDGVVKTAKYDSFKIGSEIEFYQLESALFGGGDAGDSLVGHYNMKFSTPDRDNNQSDSSGNLCASTFESGWWFRRCYQSNLNGRYKEGSTDSMSWYRFSKTHDCLKEARMMIRAAKLVDHTKIDVAIEGEPSCPENAVDGVYHLKPDHSSIPPFSVYCENGWIVIHRRFNGSLNFNRKWAPYREGFGDLHGEHWLGLEKMHQITRVGSYELMVVLKSFDGVVKTAKYDGFKIGSEIEFYQLESALFGGGDAGDSLNNHYNMKFSTPDRDNNQSSSLGNLCAPLYKSGWWFNDCYDSNLNGRYKEGSTGSMSWYHFNKSFDCLKEARMMIRAAKLVDHTKTDVAIEGEPSCPENAVDGVYHLKPDYSSIPPFSVYCENGWIVIHRRSNGSLNFNRKWAPYREGFGDLQGEHWLGLEKMHQITRVGSYELMVVLKSFDGVVKTAKYDGFKIGSEIEFYQLESALFGGGDAGDSLEGHYNMKFSTPDRDNNQSDSSGNLCAPSYESGWWFNSCYYSNLNGRYKEGSTESMSWYRFSKTHDCLKEARMMIRAAQLVDHTKIDVVIGGEPRCPENAVDGVYHLKPDYSSIPPFSVYCENGWIVIHRRFNGSLNFNRKWAPYREGFGDLQGEHWLGLEKMHQITRVGSYELMVVLKSFNNVVKTAKYEGFKIGSENDFYRLNVTLFSEGDAGDSLTLHNSMKFSTPDQDNDISEISSCATSFSSGWWFRKCFNTNLNGLYEGKPDNTMSWKTFHNSTHHSLMEAHMMIRAVKPKE